MVTLCNLGMQSVTKLPGACGKGHCRPGRV